MRRRKTAYLSPRARRTLDLLLPAPMAEPEKRAPWRPLEPDAMRAHLRAQRRAYTGGPLWAAMARQHTHLDATPHNAEWILCAGLVRPVRNCHWRVVSVHATLAEAEAAAEHLDPRAGTAIVPTDSSDIRFVRPGSPGSRERSPEEEVVE